MSDPKVVDVEPEKEPTEPSSDRPGLVLATEVLPDRLLILPLRQRPFFPGFPVPLALGAPHLELVRQVAESQEKTLGLVMVRDPDQADSAENLHRVGVAARVARAMQTEPETAHIIVNCLERFRIEHVEETDQGIFAKVRYHYATQLSVNPELKAYSTAILATLRELVQLDPLQSEAIKLFLSRFSLDDPGRLADFAANLTTADGQELQDVLETFEVRKRIDKVLVLLRKELAVAKLKKKITTQIEEKISTRQREFFLREQLKAIKKELGLEKEGKVAEIERIEARLKKLELNEEAQKAVEEELEKLRVLEPNSPEYTVTRNYLDWLTILPWGQHSRDSYSLEKARKILDRDHYGLDDVKDRIIEFIAVGKMKGEISGSILCLVGPPGVGKTSVGRSVAEALGRRFYRFSLGGMRDEAEIKGHRRTYIGSMPGKFLQALKAVGTANPVIMLDEIDKIGASFRGDPASALLEVLDPEQNSSFRDHYLDVPFDLSRVLFISTANQLDTIPSPLLDRMEMIRLAGYIAEEKVEIASRFLVPKSLEALGLKRSQVTIHKTALRKLIDDYAREAGVRGLEKLIRKIMRKAAVELAGEEKSQVRVGVKRLADYVGEPLFRPEDVFEQAPGIVTGLAWTSQGGATLQIEASAVASKNHGFKQTGQLGKVMVESSEIAYSYVMSRLKDLGVKPDFFDHHFIHLHVPAGATPKDGPSAGITMATALISLIQETPVKPRLAMSGELTLTGRVLPVGGIREKVIAARRAGCKTIVLPLGNKSDVGELADYLREGIEFHYAEEYEQVRQAGFPA